MEIILCISCLWIMTQWMLQAINCTELRIYLIFYVLYDNKVIGFELDTRYIHYSCSTVQQIKKKQKNIDPACCHWAQVNERWLNHHVFCNPTSTMLRLSPTDDVTMSPKGQLCHLKVIGSFSGLGANVKGWNCAFNWHHMRIGWQSLVTQSGRRDNLSFFLETNEGDIEKEVKVH